MTEHVFTPGNMDTSTVGDFNDGADITLGTTVKSDCDGLCTAIRWFSTAGFQPNRKMGLYRYTNESAGRFLTTIEDFVTAVNGDWNVTNLALPVFMKAGTYYVPTIYSPGNYTSNPNYFDNTTEVLNGSHLMSPYNTEDGIHNGKFVEPSGSMIYPVDSFHGNCYMVDLEFQPLIFTGDSGHTSQTPVSQNNDANSPRVLGVDFTVDVAGTVPAIKYWIAGPEHPATIEAKLFDPAVSTTVPIATKKIRPGAVGWNIIPFDSAPSINASHTYTASVHITLSLPALQPDYAFTTSGLASNIANGHVTLLANKGRYLNSTATHDYPTNTTDTDLFIDVIFVEGTNVLIEDSDTFTFNEAQSIRITNPDSLTMQDGTTLRVTSSDAGLLADTTTTLRVTEADQFSLVEALTSLRINEADAFVLAGEIISAIRVAETDQFGFAEAISSIRVKSSDSGTALDDTLVNGAPPVVHTARHTVTVKIQRPSITVRLEGHTITVKFD